MKVNAKQAKWIRRALQAWRAEGRLSEEKAEELAGTIRVVPVDWRKITQLAFGIALASAVLSLINLLADDFLLDLVYQVMNAPYHLLALAFALAAGGVYFVAWRRQRRHPMSVYSAEALMLVAAALSGCAIYFLASVVDPELAYYPPLFLMGSLLWLALGRLLPSPATWVVGILCLAAWYGTETSYRAGDGGYWLGMNLPLRFLPFGALLVLAGRALLPFGWRKVYWKSLYTLGLLTVFLALWVMSFYGNYGNWEDWAAAPEWSFLGYGLLLAVAAALAFYLGGRWRDELLRGIGALFFLLNLYTKYVEHGWDRLHGALFFLILGLSFWLIGRRAERIWEMMGES